MAGRYVLTPARRAALKKAQAKSAAKRRGTGKKRPPGKARRAGREVKRRYQAGHSGKGAIYRRQADRYNSRGYYKNRTGNKNSKKAGKLQKGYRKYAVVASTVGSPGIAAVTGVSALRNRSAKKKSKSRKGKKR